jgi:hypothetical protein
MSTLVEQARAVRYADGEIVVSLTSGGEIRFSVAQNPRLARGSAEQRNHVEISPLGLHWPDLDEDLSLRGLLAGDYGQTRR